MLNFAAISIKPPTALCAAAAIATLALAAAWYTPAHADAPARNEAAAAAPDQTPAAMRAYTLRILRVITNRRANNWVRYWQARAACDDAPSARDDNAPPRARALTAFTAAICAQLHALLGVNPADYSPRGEERTVGLLINEPGAAPGYTLFTGMWNRDIFLLDPLGRVTHAWHLDESLDHAKLLDNGNLLVTQWVPGALELDPDGNTLWQYMVERLHHDFLKMPNGNVLLLVRDLKTREEAIAAGANPEFVSGDKLDYEYLLEVRPTSAGGGEIVWEWSSWDHLIQDFDPSKPNYGAIADHPELIDINFLLQSIHERHPAHPRDWLHANAIDYNPELDQIMLSPRHFSELWIIDHSTTTEEARGHAGGNSGMGGDLLYRWGNPRAYDRGDASDQRLFWPHQPHWIRPGLPGAGNILLFNNGLEFPGDERGYSSIDEIATSVDGYRYRRADAAAYSLDKPAWTYAAQPTADFYAPIYSGTQRLPNGNTLIADGPAGTISQATPDGRIVWKYIIPRRYHASLWQAAQAPPWLAYGTPADPLQRAIKNDIYRAYFYPPDHPGLQALDLAPGAYLGDAPDLLDWARAALTAGDFGKPLADAPYEIYLDENVLIYFKQPCAAEDAQPKFFLHIVPVYERDLPADRQEHGFVNRDFLLVDAGNASADWCIAIAPLPRYPIQRIRTGQFTHAGQLWRADINLNE